MVCNTSGSTIAFSHDTVQPAQIEGTVSTAVVIECCLLNVLWGWDRKVSASLAEQLWDCSHSDCRASGVRRQLSMAEGRIKTASLGAGFPPWLHCIPPSMDFHPL